MILRPLLLTAAIGLGAVATFHAPVAEARGFVSVNIGIPAPPPPRYERVVVRHGSAWVPGHWRWNGRRHVWIGGHHVASRAPVHRGPAVVYRPAPPPRAYYAPAPRARAGYYVPVR